MYKYSPTILYAECTLRPYKSTPVLKLFHTFTGKMTRGLSLQMAFSPLFLETLLLVDQPSRQNSCFLPTILAYTGSGLTWFDYSNYATFHPHLWRYLSTQQYVQRYACLYVLRYPIRLSATTVSPTYRAAFARGAVAKPSRDFSL